ncbi:DUF6542 domain-containing protein [Streptomyces liangshanensis]|uniref:DUF6542 domain-containing protein n=1 Tax=Streptomyces liangshanensis TaxID=2717324 RepID=A0A6G9GYB6_9ACTN|nr:DUF6542 domain-containing protein [Streptomyces liangshanensis]QIQ02887.1 hypothetical protein HA039_11615 [Streptomyces liangshanensis]
MDQHRTRQPQRRIRPGTPPSPRGAVAEAASVHRVPPAPVRRVPPVIVRLRGLPNPRFTGIGAGLFATAVMLFVGFVDELLFDGAPFLYGFMFLLVSAVTALWVREADLVTAPIGVPIAFAVGTTTIAGGTGGFGGNVMAVVTALAVHAGWLYGGTLVAGLIASVRKIRQMGRRQLARDVAAAAANRAGRPPQGGARAAAGPRGAVPRG